MYIVHPPLSFSILYRIEWVVTRREDVEGIAERLFQYPVSDRMGCNYGLVGMGDRGVATFQYPVSDRMGCNLHFLHVWMCRQELSVSCIGSNGL